MAISTLANPIEKFAHDFATPLTVVKLNLGSLNSIKLRKNVRTFIGRIEQGVAEMDNLLAFKSHIKKPIIFRTTAIKEIKKIIALYSGLLTALHIKVKLNFNEDYFLEGNENKFHRIITNLLTNAIDALREVKHSRELRIESEREERGFIIKFSDNGIGIKDENLSKIFSCGFTTKKNGNGIGLYNVKDMLLKYFSALIICHSREHVGTVFEIIIPD